MTPFRVKDLYVIQFLQRESEKAHELTHGMKALEI